MSGVVVRSFWNDGSSTTHAPPRGPPGPLLGDHLLHEVLGPQELGTTLRAEPTPGSVDEEQQHA
jgi:hypothetical protein